MAFTGAVLAGIGLATSIVGAKKEQEAREKQLRIEGGLAASDRAKERRKAVRIQRIKQAQIEQAAVNTGVADSSGEFAAVGGLASDFAIKTGDILNRKVNTAKSLSASRKMGQAKVTQAVGGALQSIGFQTIAANQAPTTVGEEVDDIFNDPDLF